MRFENNDLGVGLDLGRMDPFELSLSLWRSSFEFMTHLESGALANPDEQRQVGHYWLRSPSLAPSGYGDQIVESWSMLAKLAAEVSEQGFRQLLMIGVGGSALGPQLLVDALGGGDQGIEILFIDNTDPDGFDRVFERLNSVDALVAVLSKSGGTKETRNAMLEARRFIESQGLDFPSRAIAVTTPGSGLDQLAISENWLGRLPLWSWVGGRTSITAMVGLLPLAFMGKDWQQFLRGASEMDELTRRNDSNNPALLLASAWLSANTPQNPRAMVVLPYKDRLALLARYLQQLVMESIGKSHDMQGREIRHGLTVYGNKGSTDQHAFVQQLRDGPDDCFCTFVASLIDREGESMEVSEGITAGDYLAGFLIGTRNALTQVGRQSMTLLLERVDERRLGALIALYERAVGLYAVQLGINAYHQPGVEAGKKAAARALEMQLSLLSGDSIPDNDDASFLKARLKAQGRL